MSLSEDIIKFTGLVQNWAGNISDMFYSDVAKDVTIKVIDANGDVVEKQIPNHKKMSDAFDTWKSEIGIKNTNGEVTADDGSPLSVAKFGGMTLAEYDSMYNTFLNKTKIKLAPDNKNGGMVFYDKALFVTEDNKILAWGEDNEDILNYGGLNNSIMELQQANEKIGINISKIWGCGQHIAVLYEDGDLYMRGQQEAGHFGIGNTANQMQFVFSKSNVKDYFSSSTGDQDESPMSACILNDGTVVTCGDNGDGELGIGNTTNTYTWTVVYDDTTDPTIKCVINGDNIASFHLLTASGKVFISGYNGYGQLGNGTTGTVTTLTQIVPSVDGKIIDIVATGYYDATYSGTTSLLTDSGRVYCTGYNGQGQLGNGTTTNSSTFNEIVYPDGHDVTTDPVIEIIGGMRAFFYRTQGLNLYSVGENNRGQLGIGNTTNMTAFTNILSNVTKVHHIQSADASQYSSLVALTSDNKLYGWGDNAQGHLGTGNTVDPTSPKELRFGHTSKIKDICNSGYADGITLYFVLTDGTIYGSGKNEDGQISPNRPGGYHAEFTQVRI